MKTMKRILAVVLVVVLVLVSLAVFLPTLLSTNAGRGLILRMANKGSDQKLDIGVLSLAWRGSQQVEQVSVSDPKGRQVVSVAKVSLAKGLLDLLRNSADIGLIEIVEPTVSLYPPPPLPEGAPPPKERPPRKPAERPAPRKPEKPAEPARLPSLHGEIRISGGSVLAPAAGEQVQALLKDLNVTIKLDGLDKPLEYTATLAAADDRGQLSSRGTITLPTDGVLRPTQIGADAELAVTDWDLASLAALAAAGGAPAVKGTLNLRGSLAGNLRDGLQIKNRANISALELPDEKLALGTVELVLDGKATLDSLALTDARLRSDFLTLDASGTYGGEAGTFSAKASGDLAKTSLLLTRMNVLPGDMKLAGTFQADLSGTSRGNQVVIEKNEAVLSDFVFSQAGKTFREARVTLTQKGTLDVKKETAALSPIDLHTSFGTVQLSQLDVVGWSKPIPDVKAAGRATLDLGRAAQSAGDFAGLPDGMSVAGQTAAGFSAALAAGTPASFSLESQTTGLRIKSKDAPEIVEEKVTLAAKATVSEDLAVVTIEKLDLAASPFSMTAQASFRQEGEDRSASAKGSLAFDLDRLTPYVQAFAGTNITMTGKGSKPFELATSWKGRNVADALKNANGSAAFRAESIKGFGMHVTSLDVPLEVKSGAATVDLRAQVNQGTLAAKPSADLGADKPVLTLPPKSTILGGLRLTPELADKTFGLIHPIFKGATSAGGTVSLHMENFSWPLSAEAKNEAVFAGKAEFKQVHLASSGMLISLLQAMKAREREVTILSTNVSFSCRNGRIESSPLTLGVGKHQISIVGSVGLDQTLDYQAQVPVTEDLVGSHAAKYLSGTTVKIPIRGTASKPELNLGSLNAAVADLAGQAARKAVEEKASELIRGLFKQ